jgi:hypothetical protein
MKKIDCQHKKIMKNGKIDCHLIHFENMIDELEQLEIFKNINFDDFPKINKSKNSKLNYEDIYDQELKDLVYNTFKKDFEYFGYER